MPPPHKTITAVLLAVLAVCADARDRATIPRDIAALAAPPRATPAPEHNVGGGPALPRVAASGRDGRMAWATFPPGTTVRSAELLDTRDSGKWPDRKWSALPATVDRSIRRVSADLPEGATTYSFNLTDDRGLVASSEHGELPGSTLHRLVPLGKIKPLASREIQPESRIIALGLAGVGNTKYVTSILDILKAEGLLHFVDAIAAHGYTARPEQIYPSFAKLRKIVHANGAHIEVWQGESGAPTTPRGQSTDSRRTASRTGTAA